MSVIVATFLLPYAPFARAFGFVPLPWPFLAAVIVITAIYIAAAELAKSLFYRGSNTTKKIEHQHNPRR